MPPEKPIARYSFLPWLRQGLASSITRQDNPAQGGATPPRAEIEVEAMLNQAAPVTKQVQLHGPGDVIGIDARAVIRTEPRHSIDDFEPNYTPLVEFYDEDYPWRYTPAAAATHERLRPWICLVVLMKDEFTTGKASTQLMTIIVKDPVNSLPAPRETWGWAHVHVARDVSGINGTPDQVLNAVRTVIAQDTTQAISRLICPRKLHPNLTYYAFVIPTFESGRLAGLGQPIPADINGLAPAWGAGQDTFPVYYTWQFHTGEKGDFEYLVRLLEPEPANPNVGKRPMDVQQPAPDYNIPPITTPPVLELEGALKAINMESTDWIQREPFLTALTSFLNLPADLKVDGRDEEDDPLIAPPLYGQFPAAVERVGQAADPLWFNTLNLDPRNRTAAGLGTRVVQTHQEEYMDIAWKQVGMLQEANRKLRQAQLARFFTNSLYVRHLANAPAQQAFTLTSNLHARVLIPQVEAATPVGAIALVGAVAPTGAGLPAAGNVPALSVRTLLRQSAVPATLVTPVFRKALRPRGTLMLRAAPGVPRVQGHILERVIKGELTPAPPKPSPEKAIVLDDVLQKTAPPPATGCLLSPPLVTRLSILASALHFLSGVIPSLKNLSGRLDKLLESSRENQVVNLDNWNPQQVDHIPPMPDFVLTDPGDPLPPPGFGVQDSPQAVAFRSAMKETTALFAASLKPVPPLPALKLAPVTAHILAELQPAHTIAKRIKANIDFDRFGILTPPLDPLDELLIAPDFPQAMFVPLKTISDELLLPNVGLIPPNTITLLKTNQKFIESYLVGLNHEMAREFIWREYPADPRSTYFRQFWAGTESNPNQNLSDKQRAEKLKDIKPIHTWQKTSDLGGNNNRKPGPNAEFLVLLIRGDLFKRYPNTEVYAAKAEWHDPPLKEPGEPCEIFRTPASDVFFDNEKLIRKHIFNGNIGPEIRFFGFDLDEDTARGDMQHPKNDPGWFFGLREHPGEPRFGLDEPLKLEMVSDWNDLSWANVAGSLETMETMNYITLSQALAQANVGGSIQFEASKGSNAASLAHILLQNPYKAYIHANEMLPPKPSA